MPDSNPVERAKTSENDQPSLLADLRQVFAVGGWVIHALTFLSLLALGLASVNEALLGKLNEVRTLGKLLLVTAPLTAAVAFVGIGYIRKWYTDWGDFLFITVPVVIVTALVGNWVGLTEFKWGPGWDKFVFYRPTSYMRLALISLINWYDIYGASGFVSSIIVGCFLAWAWGKKILPHFLKSPSDVET